MGMLWNYPPPRMPVTTRIVAFLGSGISTLTFMCDCSTEVMLRNLSTNRQKNTKTPVKSRKGRSKHEQLIIFKILKEKKHVENLQKNMSIEKERVKHFEKPTTQIHYHKIDL